MNLTGDKENRNRVSVRDSQTGGSVSHARTRRDATHPQLSCRSCVTVGHQRRGLFMTDEDVLDLRVPVERVVNRHRMCAWYSKHNLDAILSETFNDELAASHLVITGV